LVSSSEFDGLVPRGVFVVAAVVLEAAVEDADESVDEGTQGLVVSVVNVYTSPGTG
jgi:hypothetical protein